MIHTWVDESGISKETSKVSGKASSLPNASDLNEKYGECLASLDSVEARTRIDNVEDAYGGTLEWIFDPGLGFHDWLQGKDINTRYWIQGKPSSGKPTLMKFAHKHHLTQELLLQYHSSP